MLTQPEVRGAGHDEAVDQSTCSVSGVVLL